MGIGSTGYNILNILHILAAVVAFGPLFMYPVSYTHLTLPTIYSV